MRTPCKLGPRRRVALGDLRSSTNPAQTRHTVAQPRLTLTKAFTSNTDFTEH